MVAKLAVVAVVAAVHHKLGKFPVRLHLMVLLKHRKMSTAVVVSEEDWERMSRNFVAILMKILKIQQHILAVG